MFAPVIERCKKCGNVVTRQHNDSSFWCTCGRHWPAQQIVTKETSQNDHSDDKIVIDVPEVEKKKKKARRGKIRSVAAYTFENRATYLHRRRLTEAEIMCDENGREYWIHDNFRAGTSERVYLPERYKNTKKP